MKIYKKIVSTAAIAVLLTSSLTGCTSQDKSAVEETANTFLAIVAGDSTEDINNYATVSVAGGDFVQFFDSSALADKFSQGFSYSELSEESQTELDEFCSLFSDIIESYSVSSVEVAKDSTATALATLQTKYDIDVIQSSEVSDQITAAIEKYNTDNAEEISALFAENEASAEEKVYNDMISIILDIYEEALISSEGNTYAIVLSLLKNEEADSWYVDDVLSYDNKILESTTDVAASASTKETSTEDTSTEKASTEDTSSEATSTTSE